jgi:uncharacterized protein (UPF0335 family)
MRQLSMAMHAAKSAAVRLPLMTEEAKRKARAELRSAQAAFERAEAQRARISTARRETFERAQAAGLTLREIGEVVGLHHTRVGEILRSE